MTALLVGYGLGFMVALQVGPISLLAIRSTLRAASSSAWRSGRRSRSSTRCTPRRAPPGRPGCCRSTRCGVAFGCLGAVVLVVLGARTLWSAVRVRDGGEVSEEVASPPRAFATALAATASNPLTIASWAAVFAAASTAGAAANDGGTAVLLAGVGLGSLSWMVILASGVALARRALGPNALKAVDAFSGAGLLGFGGLLAWRTLHD